MTVLQAPLYRVPPREPRMAATGGITGREVTLIVASADYIGGTANVAEMKLWGDMDPNFRPDVFGTAEVNSRWIGYEPSMRVVTTVGPGTKTFRARLRNLSGFETDVFEATLDVPEVVHPVVLWSDGRRMLHEGDTSRFVWAPSHAVTAWEVSLAPWAHAERHECRVLESGGVVAAGGAVPVGLDTAEIEDVDFYEWQNGTKWISIFMEVGGEWYGRTVTL